MQNQIQLKKKVKMDPSAHLQIKSNHFDQLLDATRLTLHDSWSKMIPPLPLR